VFAVLRSAVLPHLLARRPHLRVWSLGCSEGQELYSVAILLRELGVDLRTVELIGSDMRAGAVQRAATGRYTETEIRGVPPEWLARYFQKESHGYRVVEEVRSNVRWRRSNAVAWESPHTHWDLILYRNLAIYLAPEAAAWTWAHLAERVSLGGVLVTGKAERPPQGLRLRRLSPCVYRRPEGHA
jgi:chemotaxis methyl-accepting protein methylase